jgi:site-specific recombinase XerD
MVEQPKKILDQLRDVLRLKHYFYRTEQSYVDWVYRFIIFHNKRHPKDMGASEIEAFLTFLAVQKKVAASTQNQALSALVFFYRHVLHQDLDGHIDAVRAKQSRYLPTVLTHEEAIAVISHLSGVYKLTQLQHQQDLAKGYGSVYLPHALERKYPHADHQWVWQYVFPAERVSKDPHSGIVRRHHLDESGLQKAVKLAGRLANINKRVSCHTFRHSFATQLLQNHYDIRTVPELLGHKDVKTTMIYTHVLNKGGHGVRSPLDACA